MIGEIKEWANQNYGSGCSGMIPREGQYWRRSLRGESYRVGMPGTQHGKVRTIQDGKCWRFFEGSLHWLNGIVVLGKNKGLLIGIDTKQIQLSNLVIQLFNLVIQCKCVISLVCDKNYPKCWGCNGIKQHCPAFMESND